MKNTRGMGFVYQPKWRDKKTGELKTAATFWVGYSANGKSYKQNAETRSHTEAVKFLKRKLAEVQSGRPTGPVVDKTTLADLLAMVEDDYRANGRRTLRRIQAAAVHLRDFFGATTKARDISSDRITSYQATRLEQGAQAATVNYELATLRRAFRLGVRSGKVAVRPEFSLLHLNNARKGFFEAEQFQAVLRHLPDHLRPLARALYETGWRKSELLSRQWKHVDMNAGWLRLEPGESKNGQGRQFPFTAELRAILEEQQGRIRDLAMRGVITPWVFFYPATGAPIRDFRGSWERACRLAGQPGKLVHDCRRTRARDFERAGVSRTAAMKMIGHETEAIYRRYAICDATMLREAAAKLDAARANEAATNHSVSKSSVKVNPLGAAG